MSNGDSRNNPFFGLFDPPSPSNRLFGEVFLGGLEESIRRRSSWNNSFGHWERAESTSETDRIERARDMVRDALVSNAFLTGQGIKLVEQGSFTNRTNTRGESDIDLRVQHPDRWIEYGYGVDSGAAYSAGGYFSTGVTYAAMRDRMRQEIVAELRRAFGRSAVDDTGTKAIKVKGLDGSRSEVDVVPCFTLHHITSTSLFGNDTVEGVAILGTDDAWTLNYPDQHITNGRAKRERTAHRFKRVVRTVKRMQADMLEHDSLAERVPSFLVECLIYAVEDVYFLVEDDDRYGRVQRVLNRSLEQLSAGLPTYLMTEINGIKPLFGGQSWSVESTRNFVSRALAHLGNV